MPDEQVKVTYEIRSGKRTGPALSRSTFSVATVLILAFVVIALFGVSILACASDGGPTNTSAGLTSQDMVTISDHAGRQVSIPSKIAKVFCTGPTGTSLVYTLSPELLVGWNITPTERELEYIPAEYRPRMGLGGWFGKNTTGNIEEIIKLGPDVVLSIGTIDEGAVSDAERVQGLLGRPVVLVDSTLTKTGDSYRFVGEILGLREKAEALASYSDDVIQQARDNTARLAEKDKVSLYYAEGGKGLHTDPEGSNHTEVFTLVGARNVADVDLQQGYGMAAVSLEQVIAWNPEVIMIAGDPAGELNVYEQITTGTDWATIRAVKDGRVYVIPHGPFDWIDRPYSIGRILGICWVGNLLYPELYDFDIQDRVKEFYKLFYHLDLTDTQLRTLMEHAGPDF